MHMLAKFGSVPTLRKIEFATTLDWYWPVGVWPLETESVVFPNKYIQ